MNYFQALTKYKTKTPITRRKIYFIFRKMTFASHIKSLFLSTHLYPDAFCKMSED